MSTLYLLDGFNFLHAVVLKGRDRSRWWSLENQRAVRDWVALRPVTGVHTWIVFDQRGPQPNDGPTLDGTPLAGLEVRCAPDADAYILACCEELRETCKIVVVSADRSLVDRAKARGARALSPWTFARYAEAGPRGDAAPSPR